MSKEFVDSFEDYGIHILSNAVPNAKGETIALCPTCSHLRKPEHQKIPCLSINVTQGYWNCFNCSWSGHLLTSDYVKKAKKETFKLPGDIIFDESDYTEKFIRFWKNRGISKETLLANKVGYFSKSIRQGKNPDPTLIGSFQNMTCIIFNFLRNGITTHIKYRDKYKNFGSSPGTELIFYGLDDIRGCKECTIVEGEPDKLAYWEAGIKNVVSVPNGAVISKKEKDHFEKTGKLLKENHQNLEYLDNCWEDFEDKETINIATDDDAAGIKLREELCRRLGYERCRIIRYKKYLCKDANEVLVKSGAEELRNTITEAEPYPIEEVVRLDDVKFIMQQQFDTGKVKGLSLGWPDLDPHFKLRFGEPMLINGYFGNGKTTFEYNMMIAMAIMYDWKCGAFMPENYPIEEAYDSLCEIYVGKTSDIDKKDRMNAKQYQEAMKFVNDHIYLVNSNHRYMPKDLRSIAGRMIKQYGIVSFFTDPWKALKHKMEGRNIDIYLEDELQEEIDFCTKNKIIKFIATHPPTPIRDKDKVYPAPSAFEIKGGEVWASMIYNLLCIHIPQTNAFEDTNTEIHIQKIKNQKLVGIPTKRDHPVILTYDRRTGRYKDSQGKSPFDKLNEQTTMELSTHEF